MRIFLALLLVLFPAIAGAQFFVAGTTSINVFCPYGLGYRDGCAGSATLYDGTTIAPATQFTSIYGSPNPSTGANPTGTYLTGFQANFHVASISGRSMVVDSVTNGSIALGYINTFLYDTAGSIASGTYVVSQSSGTAGGPGTYVLSASFSSLSNLTVTQAEFIIKRRPPWNVPGNDYPIGPDSSPKVSMWDNPPTKAQNPGLSANCVATYESPFVISTGSITRPEVTCTVSAASTVVLKGYTLTDNTGRCVTLNLNVPVGSVLVLSNSIQVNGINCYGTKYIFNSTGGSVILDHVYLDSKGSAYANYLFAGGTDNSTTDTGTCAFNASMTANCFKQYPGAYHFGWSSSSQGSTDTVKVQYSVLKDIGSRSIETGMCGNQTFNYNLILDQAGVLAHGEPWLLDASGTLIQYNAQITAGSPDTITDLSGSHPFVAGVPLLVNLNPQFNATITAGAMHVNSGLPASPAQLPLAIGQIITGSGISANTTIVSGSSSDWVLSSSPTVGPETVTALNNQDSALTAQWLWPLSSGTTVQFSTAGASGAAYSGTLPANTIVRQSGCSPSPSLAFNTNTYVQSAGGTFNAGSTGENVWQLLSGAGNTAPYWANVSISQESYLIAQNNNTLGVLLGAVPTNGQTLIFTRTTDSSSATLTFKTTPVGANDVQIGANVITTGANVAATIRASNDPLIGGLPTFATTDAGKDIIKTPPIFKLSGTATLAPAVPQNNNTYGSMSYVLESSSASGAMTMTNTYIAPFGTFGCWNLGNGGNLNNSLSGNVNVLGLTADPNINQTNISSGTQCLTTNY